VATDPADDRSIGDIWVHDLARHTATRLTFDAKGAYYPLWSPDGSRIAFFSPKAPT
jgi:Tol biopolymer transport system component